MKKGMWLALLAVVLTAVIIALPVAQSELTQKKTTTSTAVEKLNRNIVESSDKEPLQTKNSNTEVKDETVTFLVLLEETPLIDKLGASSHKYGSVKELILSTEGKSFCDAERKSQAVAKASIKKLVPEAVLDGGRTFSALFNGLTVRAPMTAREKLESIKGIDSVFVLRDDYVFFDNDGQTVEKTAAAVNTQKLTETQRSSAGLDGELIGRYGGAGTLIAVIDNGFDTEADVFSEYPEEDRISPSVISELGKRMSFNISADDGRALVYLSPKIPFAYDYAENDNDTDSEYASHGTAAASIAAGNNGEASQLPYKGAAFDAQLALMKIADRSNRISTAAFLAALDDSVKLGADIVNIGFGSYEQNEITGLLRSAFEKMRKAGMLVFAAAGNGAYNGYDEGEKPAAADIFYSSENVLSSGRGVISAGSAENSVTLNKSIIINGTKLYYTDLSQKSLTSSVGTVKNIGTALGASDKTAQYNEYIYAGEYSGKDSLSGIRIKGRLVILSSVSEEQAEQACRDAAEHGAASVAFIGASNYDIPLSDMDIPVIGLNDANSSLFSDAEGTFIMDLDGEVTETGKPAAVSEFTSYGVSDELDMGTRLVAVGEDVLAANADGGFELISGTSAATPLVSGAYAVLRQYILSNDDLAAAYGRNTQELISEVMLSAAVPIEYGAAPSDNKPLYYSPRLQGFGKLDVSNAIGAKAHFYDLSGLSSVKLGDSESDTLKFSFSLRNDSEEPRSFSFSCSVQTDKAVKAQNGKIENALEPRSLDDVSEVTFYSGDEPVTEKEIGAGMSEEITVQIKIEDSAVSELKEQFASGFYIEGYIFASAEGSTVSLPFMGFNGSLKDADIFDSTVYDDEAAVTGHESSLVAAAYKYGKSTSCELVYQDGVLLFSPEAVRSYEDDTEYGNAVILPELYTLCNVYELCIRIYDASGKALFTEQLGDFSSHRYPDRSAYEKLSLSKSFREFFSKLSRGRYTYEISARNMLSSGLLSEVKKTSFRFELDNVRPDKVSDETFSENGRLILELTASDSGGISGFELYGAAYDSKNDKYSYIDSIDSVIEAGYISDAAYSFMEMRINDNGSYTFRYDITNLSGELRKLSVNTDTWQINSLYQKIAYKAIDNAGNSSEVRLADAIEYGSAEFIFTDQNGKPAPGIGIRLGSSLIYSDRNGRAFFEKLEPDYYPAVLYYDSEFYSIDVKSYLVGITKEHPDYRMEQSVEFFGTYPEGLNSDEIVIEKTRADSFLEEQERDEPVYAFVFVGSVLAVCIMLFILRKSYTLK